MSGEVSEHDKMKVFVSYSRRDVAFADQIVYALEQQGFRPILDRHDIDAAEKWKDRLGKLILSADAIVFVLTENSAGSPVCAWEIDEADRLAKRMIPILPEELPSSVARPEKLGDLNEIKFYHDPALPGSGFARGLFDLSASLKTNLSWVREHTDLSEQAARWDSLGRSEDFLLRGEALEAARTWQAETPPDSEIEPGIVAFLAASTDYAEKLKREQNSQIAEREEALDAAKKATSRVRRAVLAGAFGVLLVGCLALWSLWNAGQQTVKAAENRAGLFAFQSRQLIDEGRHPQAALMALHGDPLAQNGVWTRALTAGFTAPQSALQNAMADDPLRRILKGHEDAVWSAQFSPDGKTALTGSRDNTARLWSLETGETLLTLKGHDGSVSSVAFSPDGKTALTGSVDNTARLWSLETGETLLTLKGHDSYVNSVQFSPDGKTALTGSVDNTARLWSLEAGGTLLTLKGHDGSVSSVAFSPDGKTALTGSVDNTARLWSLETGKTLAILKGHGGPVYSAQFSPDGKTALTGSWDKTARLWSLETGETLAILKSHEDAVWSAQFSPDGKTVLTGSIDNTARLWSLETGETLLTLKGHDSYVNSVQFSPDGKTALTGSVDNTARLWSLEAGGTLLTLKGHDGSVSSVAFSPDGKTALTGSVDNTARLWSLETGKTLAILKGHGGPVYSAQFSPDGKTALTGSWDKTARLWSLETGETLAILKSHEDTVSSAQFSPDGKTALTGSWDKTALVWSLETGETLAILKGHEHWVLSVARSPDGKTALTGPGDGTPRLWKMPDIILAEPKEQVRMACEHLRDIKAPLNFTLEDVQTYPILRGEPVIPGTNKLRSPCAGVLEGFE